MRRGIIAGVTAREANLARLVWQFGEPVHAVTYFAPETRQRTDALGLKGGWMSYFGCRAAPLGAAGPGVVGAAFYNFHPGMVHRAIPDAWSLASPQQLLEARVDAMDEALRRLLGDAVDARGVRRAADLLRAAMEGCEFAGRPMGAANAALPPPAPAHLALWQALTTMREFRGDGHVASLVEASIAPCEALVLQSATGRSDPEALRANRGWSEEAWAAAVEVLRARGWVDEAGTITDAGRAARQRVEDSTNRLAAPVVGALGADATGELIDLLRPLAEMVMSSGTVAPLNNMGVPWPPAAA